MSSVNSSLYPNKALPLSDHPPLVLLAMCIFGEARGESEEARRAIAQVVINRARYPHLVFGSRRGLMFHENVIRVVTQPSQFSCFSPAGINYVKLFDPLTYEESSIWSDCLMIAGDALGSGSAPDTLTRNSDHYFDDSIEPPSWADPAKETVKLGRLRFFRLYVPALQAASGTARPKGEGRLAAAPPSYPLPLSGASAASGKALPMSLPAPPPPMFRNSRSGFTRWLGGRELTSLEGAGQGHGPIPAALRGAGDERRS